MLIIADQLCTQGPATVSTSIFPSSQSRIPASRCSPVSPQSSLIRASPKVSIIYTTGPASTVQARALTGFARHPRYDHQHKQVLDAMRRDETRPEFEGTAKGEPALNKLRQRRDTLLRLRKDLVQKLHSRSPYSLSQTRSERSHLLQNPTAFESASDTSTVNRELFVVHEDAGAYRGRTKRLKPRHGARSDRQQKEAEDLRHLEAPSTVTKSSFVHGNMGSTQLHSLFVGDLSGRLKDIDEPPPYPSKMSSKVIPGGTGSPTVPPTNDALVDMLKQAFGKTPIDETLSKQRLQPEYMLSAGAKEQHTPPAITTFPGVVDPSRPPSPTNSSWPEPQRPFTSLSDSLKTRLPSSNLVNIDASLTVNFDAPVPELQSQIYEVCKKLKNSYPKIDALPYDIWTSSSPSTLRTWLRILVGKWQTRFDDIPRRGKGNGPMSESIDHNTKEVLDHMVRCHDLDGEAAKRMVRRWEEVFERKSIAGLSRQADEEKLDLAELDTGLAWLRDDQNQSPTEGTFPTMVSLRKPVEQCAVMQIPRVRRSASHELVSTFARHHSTTTKPASDNYRNIDEGRTTPAPENVSEPAESTGTAPALPHLTTSGAAHMVSVSAKPHTIRLAIAVGTVHFSNLLPSKLIRSNSVKKGDVLSVSRIAGIMAAKKCPELVPLCHPIMLTSVGVELRMLDASEGNFGGILIEARVQCEGQTGVEMEALTAVMGSALSVVDMCKAVDKGIRIDGVRVVLKEGGRSGLWKE